MKSRLYIALSLYLGQTLCVCGGVWLNGVEQPDVAADIASSAALHVRLDGSTPMTGDDNGGRQNATNFNFYYSAGDPGGFYANGGSYFARMYVLTGVPYLAFATGAATGGQLVFGDATANGDFFRVVGADWNFGSGGVSNISYLAVNGTDVVAEVNGKQTADTQLDGWSGISTGDVYTAAQSDALFETNNMGAYVGQVAPSSLPAITYTGTNITWDCEDGNVQELTLTNSCLFATPANAKAGATYRIITKQNATGTWAMAFSTAYKWAAGAAPTITSNASAVDLLTFITGATNVFYGVQAVDLH